MRWFHWVIVGVFCIALISLYFYDSGKMHVLKERIAQLSMVSPDTISLPGKVDTVIIKKYYRDTVIVSNDRELDTTVVMDDHRLILQGADPFLYIDLECMKPETIITRIDTIYRRELREVEVVKHELDWNGVAISYAAGVISTLAVWLILK
jgi:predicted ABC-class ATPase